MSIVYKNAITVQEVNRIRKAVKFREIHPEQLQASLDGSAFLIAAYDYGEAVGMARLIWDGGAVALIHDILVVPDYRMKGLEKHFIDCILAFLNSNLKVGFGILVDIRVHNHQEDLYKSCGFQISTQERRGTPMHICLTNQVV